jgi:hypothetical protein
MERLQYPYRSSRFVNMAEKSWGHFNNCIKFSRPIWQRLDSDL